MPATLRSRLPICIPIPIPIPFLCRLFPLHFPFPISQLFVYVMLYMLSRQIGCDWLKCEPHGFHFHPSDCYLDFIFGIGLSGFWFWFWIWVSGLGFLTFWSLEIWQKPLRVSKGKPLTASTLPCLSPSFTQRENMLTSPDFIKMCRGLKVFHTDVLHFENIIIIGLYLRLNNC